MPSLTRAAMEQAINEGGSVLYQGRLLSRLDQLPSDADLAAGNPEAEQQAQSALQAQIAALQAQLDRLQAGQQSVQQPADLGAQQPATEQDQDQTEPDAEYGDDSEPSAPRIPRRERR